jgi:RND superfamily putative drug exporter
VLGVWAVLIAVFGPLGLKLPDVTNDDVVVPSGSQTAQVARILRDRFPGGDRKPVLLVYRRPGGLTAADRARIAGDVRRARDVPLVQGAVAELVSRQRDVAVTVLALESETVFRVTPTIEELRKLERPDDGLELHVTGSPALLSDFNGAVKEADVKLLLATGALVLLLLLAVYRSPILALVPLTVVGLAYSVAAGVIYLLAKGGLPVDSTSTSLLLVLMFGAGTDYCLLLVARYRGYLAGSHDPDAAVRRALPTAAPAMIASAATVITAMLAMLAGVLGLNRTLGPVNAIGIGIVLLASLTLLPALLAAVGTRAFWPGRPGDRAAESPLWHRVGGLISRRPAHSLAALVLLLGAGCGGLAVYRSTPTGSSSSGRRPTGRAGTTC